MVWGLELDSVHLLYVPPVGECGFEMRVCRSGARVAGAVGESGPCSRVGEC